MALYQSPESKDGEDVGVDMVIMDHELALEKWKNFQREAKEQGLRPSDGYAKENYGRIAWYKDKIPVLLEMTSSQDWFIRIQHKDKAEERFMPRDHVACVTKLKEVL